MAGGEIALDRRSKGGDIHRKGGVDPDQPELLPAEPRDHHRLLDGRVRLVRGVDGELFAHPPLVALVAGRVLARGE